MTVVVYNAASVSCLRCAREQREKKIPPLKGRRPRRQPYYVARIRGAQAGISKLRNGRAQRGRPPSCCGLRLSVTAFNVARCVSQPHHSLG